MAQAPSILALPRATALLATFAALGVVGLLGAPTVDRAAAAPSDQGVRIEGRATTLYEGVLRTDGHAVATPADRHVPRRCDGTNNGAGAAPGPTPTAASDDAMRSVGMGWDGYWTPGLEDFFVQQFGPDREDTNTYAHWGLLVNGILTSVGGCQYRLNPGDQTLWVYDAFNRRDLLRLDGPGSIGEPTADAERGPSHGPVQRMFTVALGQPLTVTAVRTPATGEIGAVGARLPAPGVQVAPVVTAPNGVQATVESDPATVTTNAAGQAALAWATPGWKRIKATAPGYVRSNRLDVCVLHADGRDCNAPPPDLGPRVVPPSPVPTPPERPVGSGSLLIKGVKRAPASFSVGDLRITGLGVTTDGNPSGLVGVRWNATGGAIKAWRIDYRVPTDRKPRWRRADRGKAQLSTLLDLPTGRRVDLRIRITPPRGKSVTRTIGSVVVPIDDRVRQVRISGSRKRETDPLAWRRTITELRRGATIRAKLPAGRPTVVVRSHAKRAVIRVRAGAKGRWQRLTIRGREDGRTAIVRAKKQRRTSTVQIRVVSGTVRLDGVAVTR
ncbi:MAG: hypothetical protein ITG02_15085 [Patulibacter sp.]|nr:hypothetical protein [Patulibacter sp.]